MSYLRPCAPFLMLKVQKICSSWTQKRWATVRHAQPGRPKGAKSNWTPEKLATSDDYPMTAALYDTINPVQQEKTSKTSKGSKRPKDDTSNVHVRTQIVSPGLCDDVLKYIGRSLEKHKGCDILDINPGAGLWSQKLHDFLKPRSHVLLEPSPELFKDFLDPLLQTPDSKYKLVVKDPKSINSYREIVDEGYFPQQTRVDVSKPGARIALNNTLLVTGSLVWDPRLPGMGFDSMAKQLFHHFAAAAWNHDLFHAFGPVHTLFWVQQDDFNPIIAQGLSGMHKANCQLELTNNISLVVGAERKARAVGQGSIGREPQYELESMIRALQKGKAAGQEPPLHRRDFMSEFAKHFEEASNGTGIIRSAELQEYIHDKHLEGIVPVGLVGESFIRSNELEMKLKEKYPDMAIERFDGKSIVKKTAKFTKTSSITRKEDVAEYRKLRSTMMKTVRLKDKLEEITDIGEQMYVLECKALQTSDQDEKNALLKQIEKLDMLWDKGIAAADLNYYTVPMTMLDDRLSLRYPPRPRIQWDQRAYEPLIMNETEAWPRNRLALVSTVPKPLPFETTPDRFEWFQDFIYGLYRDSFNPITTALDSMQHGLSDIIKDCPSLKDPNVGGRLQMKHLRVRMLTVEMLKELVDEYRDWPFKTPGSDHNKYFRHKSQDFSR